MQTQKKYIIKTDESKQFVDIDRLRGSLLNSLNLIEVTDDTEYIIQERISKLNRCLNIEGFVLFMMECAYSYESGIYLVYMCSNFRIRVFDENLDEEMILMVELGAIRDVLVLNGGVSKDVLDRYKSMY